MLSRQLGRVYVASMLFVLFLSSAGMNLETSQVASLDTQIPAETPPVASHVKRTEEGSIRETVRESSFGLWFFQLFSSLRCVPGMICASSSCLLSRDHVSVLSEYPVPVVSVL